MVSAFSIGTAQRSNLDGDKRFVPGPGAYSSNIQSYKQMPKYSIGSAKRKPLAQEDQNTPGPGAYTIKKPSKQEMPKYSISGARYDSSEKQICPGPGAYQTQLDSKFIKAPGYSIAGRNFNNKFQNSGPGPGSYNSAKSTVFGVPSMMFPKQIRDDASQDKTSKPGPGAYEMYRPRSSQNLFSFPKQMRSSFDLNNTPGPGNYNIAKSLVKDGITMVARKDDNLMMGNTTTPGPGAYSPIKRERSIGVRIGTANRNSLASDVKNPGPGTYEQKFSSKKKEPAYGIGTSLRRPLSACELNVPGPGAYNYQSKVSEGPKYNITGGRYGSIGQSNKWQPGPGAYSPSIKFTLTRPPSGVFGTDTRKPSFVNITPGPGNYQIKQQSSGPKLSFGSSKRQSMDLKDTPGPGQYNIPPKFNDVPKYLIA